MQISSPAFENDQQIPQEYTADGERLFAPLAIAGVPESAQSLVILIDDPDCPPDKVPGGLFDHWLIWNVDPSVTEIDVEESIEGVVGTNGWDKVGFAVPEPPPGHGEHRYYFKLFALDTTLDLSEGSKREALLAAIEGHVIADAQYVGRYTCAAR